MADRPTAVPPFTPGDKRAQQGASGRLESWKEIAAHLNRTLRTVQRWEKSEGLPVHRHQHEERASVYAFKSEIDAWWKTRRNQLEQEAKQQGLEEEQVSEEVRPGPTPAGKVSYSRWSVWLLGVTAAAILALLVFLLWNRHVRWQSEQSLRQMAVGPLHSSQVTLAVLPFKNLSGEHDIDYLRIALPDQIATILSYSSDIAVRPFASTENYAERNIDPQTAGRGLRVAVVVTGHFLREGDRLLVTLEAVDVEGNRLLWTDTVKVASTDLTDLDNKISSRTQQRLVPYLTSDGVVSSAVSRPQSPDAFDLYLRSLAISRDVAANKQAVSMLERAIALDPSYAPGWQQLALRYYWSGHDGGGNADLDRAQAASQRALALNPNFPDAARILIVSRTERGNLEGAYTAALDFLRRRPNDALAHASMGYVLKYAGLLDESVREYETALRLDPTNYILHSGALAIMETGDYARAHEFLRVVDAGSDWSEAAHAKIFLQEGKYEQAEEAFRRSSDLAAQTVLAYLNHRPLAEIEAQAAKSEETVLAWPDPEDKYWTAADFSFCRLNERALKLLRLAVEGNYLGYPAMDRDPLFINIRGTPEFAAIRALAIQKQNQFLDHRAEHEHKSVVSRN